ncbi:TPA: hypothetical protein VB881_000044 [Streptococcus suis]|uniref:hypothetical protein n=1 Tax=Streptococcus suis TaxID=1307 RepID=UPI00137517E6|nr:hypothetical protein [Streptococcus suis]HEM6309725.1 hypothetical protein [Streptococcus suis]HEP1793455.1 hypothetical protein [Streptococcus suis]
MLSTPKGYKFWIDGENGTELSSDAPDWAVREFQDYMNMMLEESEDDVVIHI